MFAKGKTVVSQEWIRDPRIGGRCGVHGLARFITLSNVIVNLFSNHSPVKREQIIFTLEIIKADKNQQQAMWIIDSYTGKIQE